MALDEGVTVARGMAVVENITEAGDIVTAGGVSASSRAGRARTMTT